MALPCVMSSRVLFKSVCRMTLPRLSGVPCRVMSSTVPKPQKEWVEVTYKKTDGTTFTVQGKEGDNLLDVAINNDLDLDGFGACEGTLACSTCHLIFKKEDFDNIDEICTDEELDMLDLAYGLTDTNVSLSLSGSGFLGVYQLGALECLHQHTPKLIQNAAVGGASAGALLAACVVCGVPLETVKSSFIETAIASQQWTMGPFNPNFKIEEYVKLGVEALPCDAHVQANGRLFVSITRVNDFSNDIVSHWVSREDLIQCLLCSCFLPVFSGVRFPLFRGKRCIDGGFTNNLPIVKNPSITISPFEGIVDISPKSKTNTPRYVKVANEDLAVTVSNLVRFVRALFPPTAQDLDNLYTAGYYDAYRFIKKRRAEYKS